MVSSKRTSYVGLGVKLELSCSSTRGKHSCTYEFVIHVVALLARDRLEHRVQFRLGLPVGLRYVELLHVGLKTDFLVGLAGRPVRSRLPL